MKKILFLMAVFFLLQASVSEAQTTFVQSRYYKSPNSPYCETCRPNQDGIVHVRFKPMATRVFSDAGENKFEFVVQFRKTGEAERYLNVGAFRITYNEEAFGDYLNAPIAITSNGGQCVVVRGDLITNTRYILNFRDFTTDEFGFEARHRSATALFVEDVPKERFSLLTPKWQDLLKLTCTIPAGGTDADADVAISGTEPIASSIREFPPIEDPPDPAAEAANRPPVLLPDNDLRGFRLDGKTWAEDYSRYGDGTGVRVKFSKPISTALAAANFAFEDGVNPSTSTISNVTHAAGSPYAAIAFDRAVTSGVLRLVSTSTNIVMDEDNNPLADDSFLASLFYDADAPRVAGIKKVSGSDSENQSTSTWIVSFTKPINPATVGAEDFCITVGSAGDDEAGDVCPKEGTPTTPSVITAVAVSANTTQVEVIIEEGDGRVESTRSLEFRRNAVFGKDLEIVEDYQAILRDAIKLEDRTGPILEIRGGTVSLKGADGSTITYRVQFLVHADEPIDDLFSPDSYKLLRLEKGEWKLVDVNLRVIKTTLTDSMGVTIEGRTVLIFADVGLPRDEEENTEAFALARADGALEDSSGNPPKGTGDVGLLNQADPQAESTIDRTDQTVEVVAQNGGIARIDMRNDTDITYNMSFMVFTTSRDFIGGLDQENTYELLRVLHDSSTATTVYTPSAVDFQASSNTAIVRYEGVQLSVEESEQTRSFTLGRRSAGVLVTQNGRQPLNANEMPIAPRTRIDPRPKAEARIILRLKMRAKVFLEGAME